MINVTVIVPVYKVPLEYLRECLDSLLAQTLQECEFIVVSDGAPDAECAVCDEYAKKDSRFKFFRREHAGVSATRNYGIEKAQGEYITFVDSDDWISSNTCLTNFTEAKKYNADMVICDFSMTTENRKKIKKYYLAKSNRQISGNFKYSLLQSTITSRPHMVMPIVSCKFIKKNLLNEVRFPEKLTFSEDRAFNFVVLSKCKKVAYLHKICYFYRIHEQSTGHKYLKDAWNKKKDFFIFMQENASARFQQSIASATICDFIGSWKVCYMHKSNKDSLNTRINQIKEIWDSKEFKNLTSGLQPKDLPLIPRIEAFLLSKHIYALLWLHGIKNLLLK